MLRISPLAIILIALASCGGDSKGPVDPTPHLEPTITLSKSDTIIVSVDWPTTRFEVCATVKNVVTPVVDWLRDGSVVSTGNCFAGDFTGGILLLTSKVRGTSLEKSIRAEIVLSKPTLTLINRDTVITQLAPVGATITLRSTISNGDSTSIEWTDNGVVRAQTSNSTIVLGTGEHFICSQYSRDQSIKHCFVAKVIRPDILLDAYLVSSGAERPIVGVRLCMTASNFPAECSDLSTGGNMQVRPSFIDRVTMFRLRFEGQNILPLEVEIPYEKMFSQIRVYLIPSIWIIGMGSEFSGQSAKVSMKDAYEESAEPWFGGLRSLFQRSLIGDVIHYDLRTFRDTAFVSLGDSVENDPYMNWGSSGLGPFTFFSSSDSALVLQFISKVQAKFGVPKFVLTKSGRICGSIVFRRRVDRAEVGTAAFSCNSTGPVPDGPLTGGYITLGSEIFSTDFPEQRAILNGHTFDHEMIHLIIVSGHTCSPGKTVMFWPPCYQGSNTHESLQATPEDISYVQVRYRTAQLMRKYGPGYGIAETLHAELGTIPIKYDIRF